MSNEAVNWALRDAPGVPPHCAALLFGLANVANEDGRGAYPSVRTLARYTRKDERNVRKDLRTLESLGIIRRGDQRFVAHIEADRRPVVWDLAMERHQTLEKDVSHGGTQASGRGGTQASGRGGTQASPNPSVEPSVSLSPQERAVARRLPDASPEEREKIRRYINERKRGPFNPYLKAISNEDLQAWLAEVRAEPGERGRDIKCSQHHRSYPDGAECPGCAADRKAVSS